jgi:hypothetical protein
MQRTVMDENSCQLSWNVSRSYISTAASPPDVPRICFSQWCLDLRANKIITLCRRSMGISCPFIRLHCTSPKLLTGFRRNLVFTNNLVIEGIWSVFSGMWHRVVQEKFNIFEKILAPNSGAKGKPCKQHRTSKLCLLLVAELTTSCLLLVWLTLKPWRWHQFFPSKLQWISTRLRTSPGDTHCCEKL